MLNQTHRQGAVAECGASPRLHDRACCPGMRCGQRCCAGRGVRQVTWRCLGSACRSVVTAESARVSRGGRRAGHTSANAQFRARPRERLARKPRWGFWFVQIRHVPVALGKADTRRRQACRIEHLVARAPSPTEARVPCSLAAQVQPSQAAGPGAILRARVCLSKLGERFRIVRLKAPMQTGSRSSRQFPDRSEANANACRCASDTHAFTFHLV
jgi:hypothetical protein